VRSQYCFRIIISLLLVFIAGHANAGVLTLRDSISYALNNNLTVRTYANSIENAKLDVWVREMDFSPSVRGSVYSELTGNSGKTSNISIEKPLKQGGSISFDTSVNYLEFEGTKDYTSDSLVKFTYPLLKDRGSFYATYNLVSADRQLQSITRGYDVLRQQLILDVITSYYKTVESLLLTEVNQKSLERAEALLAASSAKLRAGLVTKIDLYRAEIQVLQSKNNLAFLADSIESSKNSFKNLIGLSLDSDFSLETKIEYSPEDFDEARLIEKAFASRAEIKDAEAKIEDGERALKLAKNNLWPRLDWWVGYGAQGHGPSVGKSYSYNNLEFRTGFTLTGSLSPWADVATVKKAERDIEDKKTALQALKNNISLEIKQYLSAMKQYRARIDLNKVNVDLAEKQLEFASLRFKKGFADNFTVKEAEEKIIDANVQYISALINAILTDVKIRKASGGLNYFD